MNLKPEIEAEVTILPPEMNSRKGAIRDDIVGYFECSIELPNGTWDCRIVFPDANGRVELGQTTMALIQFLNPKEALSCLNTGNTFQLMGGNGIIANGKVAKLIATPINPIKNELRLEFTGSAREYFRIWAVNLCLTLLTAGIFSAWAKVRKKRYFYSHTILNGTPFQYLGQPLPILRGRIIGVTLFAVYYVSRHFLTSFLPYFLALGVMIAPWVVVRSASFNARYSAFRNLTFKFTGSYRDTYKVVYAWGIIPVLIAGTIFNWWNISWLMSIVYVLAALMFPWWFNHLKRFIVGHTEYGGVKGALFSTGWQFFKIYFRAGLLLIVIMIFVYIQLYQLNLTGTSRFSFIFLNLPAYLGYVLAYAYVQAQISNVVWNGATLWPVSFRSTLLGRTMAMYYLTNALAIIVSAGLLTPWAVIRTMKYRAENLRVLMAGELTDFSGSDMSPVSAAGAEIGEFFDMDLSL